MSVAPPERPRPESADRDADESRDRTWRGAAEARATPRRLAGSIGLSAVLHVAVIVALLVRGAPTSAPSPPVYRVDLVAAPPGRPAIGTVAAEPPRAGETPAPAAATPAPARPTPAPAPPPRPAPPPKAMPAPTPARTRPAPVAATPVPPRKAAPATTTPARPTPARPAATKAGEAGGKPAATGPVGPRAAGGAEGGRGADVANVRIAGLEFDHPVYLQNIVRQIRIRFTPPTQAGALQADIAFLIHRDGSVSDVRVVKSSRNYAFDLEARGAIEATGSAGAFGPLPTGFKADVLPVTFSFDPRVIR